MTNATPANEFVTDTMGLVLHIERRKSGPKARAIFDAVESGNATVYVPTLVFAEILYLSEKQRISLSLGDVASYLKRFPGCREYPMSFVLLFNQPPKSWIFQSYMIA